MKHRLLILFILNLILVSNLYSQANSLTLNNSDSSDRNISLYDVFYINNKIESHEKIISNLEKEIYSLQSKINSTRTKINKIKYLLNDSKDLYSRLLYTIYIYKLNYSSSFIFLFAPSNFNKIYNRYNYIKMILNYLSSLHNYLKILQNKLATNQKLLKSYQKSLNILTKNKLKDKHIVDSLFNSMNQQISYLNQRSYLISQQLQKSNELNEQITNFLSSKHSISTTSSNDNFKLTSPLNDAVLISSFGVHNHPYIHNVQIKNDGVDLTSQTDHNVKAAASGVVAKIILIPNNGYSIILKHNTYYTVYSYLSKTFVNEKDTVFRKQKIGLITKKYSKYSFPALNFQVWHSDKKINPSKFLNF